MLKLLIFDLDGTLADTARDIADALNYAITPFSPKTYSVEETKAMVGSGISNLLQSLIAASPSANDRDAKEEVTKRFLEFYSAHLLDNTKLYPHVKETLSGLGAYKKAVLSNKRETYSREIMDRLEILEYFDTVWGSDSVREKKPSPVPVLDLIKKYEVSKAEAALIGDSNYDVDAGKAAGIMVIGASYGFRSVDYLKEADFIIDSFDKIPGIIKSA